MNLTAEGKYFQGHFLDILKRIDELTDSANDMRRKVAGDISITTPINSSGLGIDAILMNFMGQYPEVKIIWREFNRNVDLIDEGVDLAIRVGDLSDSNLIARRYGESEVLFVASPEYLKRNGTPAHPKELNRFDCIVELLTTQPWRWRYQDENIYRWVNVKGKIEVKQGNVVARFAAAGKGIARLPSFVVQPYLEQGMLVPILQNFQTPSLPVSLLYPANRMMNSTLKTLINFILENSPG